MSLVRCLFIFGWNISHGNSSRSFVFFSQINNPKKASLKVVDQNILSLFFSCLELHFRKESENYNQLFPRLALLRDSAIVEQNWRYSCWNVCFFCWHSSSFQSNQLIWRRELKALLIGSIWRGTRTTLRYTTTLPKTSLFLFCKWCGQVHHSPRGLMLIDPVSDFVQLLTACIFVVVKCCFSCISFIYWNDISIEFHGPLRPIRSIVNLWCFSAGESEQKAIRGGSSKSSWCLGWWKTS